MEGGTASLALAIVLAGLAGWVDATGFIHFRGLFVSFMSGNSTQAAVAAAAGDAPKLLEFGRTIALFVGGVALGELVAAASGSWRRTVVLGLEGALLVAAAVAVRAGFDRAVLASCLALAMGVQNAVLHKAAGLTVGLTYVTGALVQVGRGVAGVLRREVPWSTPMTFLGLWLGLISGGYGGALLSVRSLFAALVVATGWCGLALGWTLAERCAGRWPGRTAARSG